MYRQRNLAYLQPSYLTCKVKFHFLLFRAHVHKLRPEFGMGFDMAGKPSASPITSLKYPMLEIVDNCLGVLLAQVMLSPPTGIPA